MSAPSKVPVNPSLQAILDKDVQVHDTLIGLVDQLRPEHKPMGLILAIGLASIHTRLGEMWRWDKAVDPS